MIHFNFVKNIGECALLAKMCGDWAKEMGYALETYDIFEDIKRTYQTGVVVYAKDDDQFIGMMSGLKVNHFWIKEEWAHEHWFFIIPSYRNRKVGDKLQNIFCEWAKINGCKSVIIQPNLFGSVNPKVIADSLEKRGYTLHGYSMRKEL